METINDAGPNDHPDCSICRAKKTAEGFGRDLIEDELRQAFLRAKDEGVVVGGDWFEKDATADKNQEG